MDKPYIIADYPNNMNLSFPLDVEEWTWETFSSLRHQSENQYLEYKQRLHARDEDSKKKWQRSLEQEIVAFANASGGILVFGISDEGKPVLFEPPEHEVKQSVTQIIQNTKPIVDIDISDPITPPSADTDNIALVVRVHEAMRKPVLTSDSAVYMRVNDRKEPMSREQMESLFIDYDRRQQAIRLLEMEIDRFYDSISRPSPGINVHDQAPPDFHRLDIDSLKEVLRENTHLYADDEAKQILTRVFRQLRAIENQEVYFGRTTTGHVENHYGDTQTFYYKEREKLKDHVERLERALKDLAEVADLDVKMLGE